MPRYYFHIRDGRTLVLDEEGMECRDLLEAQGEALDSARDLAKEAMLSGARGPIAQIEIEDEDGNAVAGVRANRVLN
jgi:hypothetical protein